MKGLPIIVHELKARLKFLCIASGRRRQVYDNSSPDIRPGELKRHCFGLIYLLFYVTVDDILDIYVMAYRYAGGPKKFYLPLGSKGIDIKLSSSTCPSKHGHGAILLRVIPRNQTPSGHKPRLQQRSTPPYCACTNFSTTKF